MRALLSIILAMVIVGSAKADDCSRVKIINGGSYVALEVPESKGFNKKFYLSAPATGVRRLTTQITSPAGEITYSQYDLTPNQEIDPYSNASYWDPALQQFVWKWVFDVIAKTWNYKPQYYDFYITRYEWIQSTQYDFVRLRVENKDPKSEFAFFGIFYAAFQGSKVVDFKFDCDPDDYPYSDEEMMLAYGTITKEVSDDNYEAREICTNDAAYFRTNTNPNCLPPVTAPTPTPAKPTTTKPTNNPNPGIETPPLGEEARSLMFDKIASLAKQVAKSKSTSAAQGKLKAIVKNAKLLISNDPSLSRSNKQLKGIIQLATNGLKRGTGLSAARNAGNTINKTLSNVV